MAVNNERRAQRKKSPAKPGSAKPRKKGDRIPPQPVLAPTTKGSKNKPGSGVEKGLKALAKETGQTWVYDSNTRGAINQTTGEKLSRRQFDKRYGLLQQQGFMGFKQKATARAIAGLKGFKKEARYPNVLTKSFKTREEMMLALIELSDKRGYVFRVLATGQPKDEDRYKKAEDDDGEFTFFTDALAASNAEDLFDYYDEKAEKKFSKISKWTLVAMPDE